MNESNPGAVDQTVLDLTINDIRNRVKLPGYQKGDLPTQEDVRKAVRKERRVELAFEGFRYFDVLRWGIAEQELNHSNTGKTAILTIITIISKYKVFIIS